MNHASSGQMLMCVRWLGIMTLVFSTYAMSSLGCLLTAF